MTAGAQQEQEEVSPSRGEMLAGWWRLTSAAGRQELPASAASGLHMELCGSPFFRCLP